MGTPFKMNGPLFFGSPDKQKKTSIEAIKEVDASSTGYSNQDKSKMETEKAIYLAKLRGDYIDLTGKKGKNSMVDDVTGTVVSKYPNYTVRDPKS
jgi:hypothetical protein